MGRNLIHKYLVMSCFTSIPGFPLITLTVLNTYYGFWFHRNLMVQP